MHEAMAQRFQTLPAWAPVPEVSFSIYGERGVIDWVAWHAETQTLLIVELKTQLVDVQDLLSTMHRRLRLAPAIASTLAWSPKTVGAWVVVEDGRTNRRHVANHRSVLRTAFPDDGRAIGKWLRQPDGAIRCLSFLPILHEAKRVQAGSRDRGVQIDRPHGLVLPTTAADERLAGFRRSVDVDGSLDEPLALS